MIHRPMLHQLLRLTCFLLGLLFLAVAALFALWAG